MKTYQYTSPENTVVHVIDEDGISRMSMLASAVPDGVEILPYVEPPEPVPQQITRAQGKAALIMQGLWGAVLGYVASMQDPTQRALAEVALNDTLTWERSSPFLNAAAAGLGVTDEQLDALFIQAAGIAL